MFITVLFQFAVRLTPLRPVLGISAAPVFPFPLFVGEGEGIENNAPYMRIIVPFKYPQ
jgi:hypothetical protein